jgi:hypothetical protein
MMPKKTELNNVRNLFLINLFNTFDSNEFYSTKRQLIPNLFFDRFEIQKSYSTLWRLFINLIKDHKSNSSIKCKNKDITYERNINNNSITNSKRQKIDTERIYI